MQKRESVLESLNSPWDAIIIGGGITGAGILREAAGAGLRCLLLEQRDFAWGTSSRSGKLVHGGLRYLRQGQVKTTWHSVRQREKMLRDFEGLVEHLGFLLPTYRGGRFSPVMLQAGLAIYDLIALRRSRRRCSPEKIALLAPALKAEGINGCFWYRDARTDDARLVLRVISDGVRLGGAALNYARVEDILIKKSGRVRGVHLRDVLTGRSVEVRSQVVINATGAWAGNIRSPAGSRPRLRPLRGSHLVFPRWRFPLALAVNLIHPGDGRPLYVFPWEGVTLLGTTDLDHHHPLSEEPRISPGEGQYLLDAVRHYFPSLDLTGNDALSTFSGVRPVVDTGKKDPSKESRDHAVWCDNGLITVTGGKLTTFGLLAGEALAHARKYLNSPAKPSAGDRKTGSCGLPAPEGVDGASIKRLSGRYGPDAEEIIKCSLPGDLTTLPGTETLWAEIRWAAGQEGAAHLDDIMLRRTRLGILAPEGGAHILPRIREAVQPAAGWDDRRWEEEAGRYLDIWRNAYSPHLLKGTN
ncbi:MAG: glycerol-3-phosphate dehydrogenase/oxidase [Bacillota bacterium]